MEVGRVYSWRNGLVNVVVTQENLELRLGDLLYVKMPNGYIILEVVGHEGSIPAPVSSLASIPLANSSPLYNIMKEITAVTRPIFRIVELEEGKKLYVTVPQNPPPLDAEVKLISNLPSDKESLDIVRKLCEGVSEGGVGLAWLRSGSAYYPELRESRYFSGFTLRLDLYKAISKHVLVSGSTGSGKTTSVMGMILSWVREGEPNISWLVFDRHGEYGKSEYVNAVKMAMQTRRYDGGIIELTIYDLVPRTGRPGEEGRFVAPLKSSSINAHDVISVIFESPKGYGDMEVVLEKLSELVSQATCSNQVQGSHSRDCIPPEAASMLLTSDGEPTLNLLALFLLIMENLVPYERGAQGKGIYTIFKEAGVYVNMLRYYKNVLMINLGLRTKGKEHVKVIDDAESIFKVPSFMKEPCQVARLLKALASRAGSGVSYPWTKAIKEECNLSAEEEGISAEYIADTIEKPGIHVVDLVLISPQTADVISMSLLRKIFTKRLREGVEVVGKKPIVAVVSEEAPLYLSSERVNSPFNIFARIAREGRKFGIGLIAITQQATLIDKQILANFNTIIALRTKSPDDLRYFSTVGIPGENLTVLGEREGYLYTTDLRVKDPIPVYIPTYYDEEVRRALEKESARAYEEKKTLASLIKGVIGSEDSRS